MLPGPSLIINCPNCGSEKKLISLLSGNTFGAKSWSDTKQEAPMLPRLSVVQKCPHCGHYFMLPDEKPRYSKTNDYTMDTGDLPFEEMKPAFLLLENEVVGTDKELALRLSFIHSFNDAFRFEEKDLRNKADWDLHKSNLLATVPLLKKQGEDSIPVIAEFYREAEEYQRCLDVLDSYIQSNDFLNAVCDEIRMRAKNSDPIVFEIK